MMKLSVVSSMIIGVMSLCMAAETSTNGYQLVWADEFNVDGPPNPKNWTFEKGFVRNNELQWYQPKNPFQQPHYLLLNLAIGGNAGGDPSKTPFPTQYEIDYVRIFQKKE